MEKSTETHRAITREQHWQSVYLAKTEGEISWHQDEPGASLDLIGEFAHPGSRVLDVGGGSSVLAGRLVDKGFTDVTVLDVSAAALERAKARIGPASRQIRWIVADVTAVSDLGRFDVWHDRAVFHFLTESEDRKRYVALAERTLELGGWLVIAAFALDGPSACSGLSVQQYDGAGLARELDAGFALRKTVNETHQTPWGKSQQFTYAVFERTLGRQDRGSKPL